MNKRYLLAVVLIAFSVANAEPRVRPVKWAQPIIGAELKNWYKIDDKLYRSAQPDDDEFKEVEKFGITNILNI